MPLPHENPLEMAITFDIQFSHFQMDFFAISSFARIEEITYDIRNTTIVTYLFKSRKCDAIAT